MIKPTRTAPRCVQWAAVILVAIPVFSLVVAFNVTSFERLLSQWPILLPSLGFQIALGIGLIYGINLVRLLFAGLVIWAAATEVFVLYYNGFSSMSLVANITPQVGPFIALGLCFLPAANRFFSGKESAENKVAEPSTTSNTFVIIGLLAIVLLVGLVAVRHFSPLLENASVTSREQQEEHDRIYQEAYEREMVNNCRMLATAMNQFFFEQPTLTKATYADLVGPNKFIGGITPVAGEKYPSEFVREGKLIVVLHDGARLEYNPNTGETNRRPVPKKVKPNAPAN